MKVYSYENQFHFQTDQKEEHFFHEERGRGTSLILHILSCRLVTAYISLRVAFKFKLTFTLIKISDEFDFHENWKGATIFQKGTLQIFPNALVSPRYSPISWRITFKLKRKFLYENFVYIRVQFTEKKRKGDFLGGALQLHVYIQILSCRVNSAFITFHYFLNCFQI